MKTISFDVNVPSNVTITIPKEGEKLNIGVNVVKKRAGNPGMEELRKIFKDGDFVVLDDEWVSIYEGEGDSDDTISDYCGCYLDEHVLDIHSVTSRVFNKSIKHATAAQKQVLLDYLKRNGREWNGKELVEVPKKGDFVIVWDSSYKKARIDVYDHYNSGAFDYPHCTRNTAFINAVKWDGTKDHFERVLRGEF